MLEKRTWTKEKILELEDLYSKNLTYLEIAEKLNTTPYAINSIVTKNKLSKRIGVKHNKKNIYDLSGEYGIGWTSNTNEEFYFDKEDYGKIKDYCWHERRGYISSKNCEMHRIILGVKEPNEQIDHKNRKRNDNRKENLRIVSPLENAINHSKRKDNVSGISGVFWNPINKRWRVYLYYKKQSINIGSYFRKEDAIKKRLEAELKYYGIEFAPQRHLFEEYGILEDLHNGQIQQLS